MLNDAKGWEDDPTAESEPTDPAKIKGNYTHGELPPEHAYRLTVPIGMANDYNGYIVTYREYQRGDHYRKSLTAWGPHASDYMATRLVKLGGQLKGAEPPPTEPLEPKIAPDLAHNDARAEVLGTAGKAALESYEATLPNDRDGGTVVEQPQEVLTRFDAATFTWNGGSNYIDLPEVRVQRKVRGEWVDYADQSGEVPLTLQFPQAQDAATYLGGQRWPWTAHFEAFVSDIDAGGGRATPAGTYRFSVQGVYRDSMGRKDYSLTSNEFQVEPWHGHHRRGPAQGARRAAQLPGRPAARLDRARGRRGARGQRRDRPDRLPGLLRGVAPGRVHRREPDRDARPLRSDADHVVLLHVLVPPVARCGRRLARLRHDRFRDRAQAAVSCARERRPLVHRAGARAGRDGFRRRRRTCATSGATTTGKRPTSVTEVLRYA